MLVSLLLVFELFIGSLLHLPASPLNYSAACRRPLLLGLLLLFILVFQTVWNLCQNFRDFTCEDLLAFLNDDGVVWDLNGELFGAVLLAFIPKSTHLYLISGKLQEMRKEKPVCMTLSLLYVIAKLFSERNMPIPYPKLLGTSNEGIVSCMNCLAFL